MLVKIVRDGQEFLEELVHHLEQEKGNHLDSALKSFLPEKEIYRLPAEVFSDYWEDYRDSKYFTAAVNDSRRGNFIYNPEYRKQIEKGNLLNTLYAFFFDKKFTEFSVLDNSLTILRARKFNPWLKGYNNEKRYDCYRNLYRIQSWGYEHVFEVNECLEAGEASRYDKFSWFLFQIPAYLFKELKNTKILFRSR